MNILIVEDDPIFQTLLQEEFSGHEVVVVDSVDRALAALQVRVPQIILLDIMLPGGKNGFDLLEDLQRSDVYKKIPVIVMTNLDSEKIMAGQMGCTDYIVKSNLDLDTLKQKVETLATTS